MKKHALAWILAFCVTGCAPVTKSFYLPIDADLRNEGHTCGWSPYGGYSKQVTPNVRISADIYPIESGLDVGITLILSGPPLPSMIANNSSLVVTPSGGRNDITKLVVFSQPKHIIDGYLHSFARVKIEGNFPPHINISLIGINVDGKAVGFKNVEFELVNKTGVMACVQ